MRATRAIIHLDNLKNNIRIIKNHLPPGIKICLAIKADAYGHGAKEVAKVALDERIDSLGVATADEGRELRQAGINIPIILLSLPIPEEIPGIIKDHLVPVVASIKLIHLLSKEGKKQEKPVTVHLKIDTGMGRIGCTPSESVKLAEEIIQSPFLKLGGVCTHFPCADKKAGQSTDSQITLFRRSIENILKKGINPGIKHTANSGAIIALPESYFDMVRPGIIAYGYYPSKEQERILPLKPVMELRTKIVFLKKVPEGSTISYGMTYRTKQETWIATIPIGYGDGYSRLLSGKAEVLIKGKRYPLVGTICMDQCMIDLGPQTDIKLFDEVSLFGPDKTGPDAEVIADIIGSIPYEVTCLVSKRVPRVYKE